MSSVDGRYSTKAVHTHSLERERGKEGHLMAPRCTGRWSRWMPVQDKGEARCSVFFPVTACMCTVPKVPAICDSFRTGNVSLSLSLSRPTCSLLCA